MTRRLLRSPARAVQTRTLLSGTDLSPLLTFGRTQTGFSTAENGGVWTEVVANTARYTSGSLVIEGERVNRIRNPRFEGGAAGVTPTNMTTTLSSNGITATVRGIGTANGLPYLEIGLNGTASANSFILIYLEGTNNIGLTIGQSATLSAYHEVVSGTYPTSGGGSGTGVRFQIEQRDSGAANLTTLSGTVTATAAQGSLLRLTQTFTADAEGVAYIRPAFTWRTQSGTTITDAVMRLYAPQCETVAGYASSPILPVAGSPAISTRGNDLLSVPLSSLNVGARGVCTILWRGVIPQSATTGTDQVIFQIDDGSNSNRYAVVNFGGGNTIRGRTSSLGSSAGSMTPGTAFNVGATVDASGRIAYSVNGGAVVTITGGPTSGLTTLRVGNNATGASAMFGRTSTMRVMPSAVSDAQLQALVASLT